MSLSTVIIGLAVLAFLAWGIYSTVKKPAKYRVVKNALGKFQLQSYECFTPQWLAVYDGDPRKDYREYGYKTLIEFDTFEEASQAYYRHMADFNKKMEEDKEREAANLSEQRQKELANTVVKVYKMK